MKTAGCSECERLWRAYADTTFEFVRTDATLKMAKLRNYGNYDDVVKLWSESTARANYARLVALQRLKEHEATHEYFRAAASGA